MSKAKEYINSDRHDFDSGGFLDIKKCPEMPAELFDLWIQYAIDQKVSEPYAFNLATVDKRGAPHARILYMRDILEDGLVFYTNYNSGKGENMTGNNQACMTFFWPELSRQIRVEGKVEKLDAKLSDLYFASRPRASQIGAWASQQSEELSSRLSLEKRIDQLTARYDGLEIPRPENWGGYRLKPHYYEFWLGQASRLHDRIVYSKNNNSWDKKRLNP